MIKKDEVTNSKPPFQEFFRITIDDGTQRIVYPLEARQHHEKVEILESVVNIHKECLKHAPDIISMNSRDDQSSAPKRTSLF